MYYVFIYLYIFAPPFADAYCVLITRRKAYDQYLVQNGKAPSAPENNDEEDDDMSIRSKRMSGTMRLFGTVSKNKGQRGRLDMFNTPEKDLYGVPFYDIESAPLPVSALKRASPLTSRSCFRNLGKKKSNICRATKRMSCSWMTLCTKVRRQRITVTAQTTRTL